MGRSLGKGNVAYNISWSEGNLRDVAFLQVYSTAHEILKNPKANSHEESLSLIKAEAIKAIREGVSRRSSSAINDLMRREIAFAWELFMDRTFPGGWELK